MTLASNTMTKHMRTTSLTPSEHTTHSRKIGTAHYTAESPSNGTTHNATSTSPCQTTSTSSSPDSNTHFPRNHNIAHTAPHHDNLGRQHKIRWITTYPQHYPQTGYNESNKLWAPSCTMPRQLTSPRLLHSAASPPSKHKQQNKPNNMSTHSWTTSPPTEMPPYDMSHQTWFSTYTPMHHIYRNQEHEVALEAHTSWGVFQEMDNP